jgi:Protein of unknown function DUF262
MAIAENFLQQLREVRVIKKTITRSVQDLVANLQNNTIIVPPYQRNFVWDREKQYRFIESIFMDVPIPPLFFLEKFDEKEGSTILEIIDGVQRLTTLENFVNGDLKLGSLETLKELNQSTFNSLPPNLKGLFSGREINTIVIESGTDPEIQFEVFGRLNNGSVSLNAQELRNCIFHGEWNDFIIKCSKKDIFRELVEVFPKFRKPKKGQPDKCRMLDVEMILRFFTLYEGFDPEKNKYPAPKKDILNEYMREKVKQPIETDHTQNLESVLEKVLTMLEMTFKKNPFKSFSLKKDDALFSGTPNQAVFDVQMLGFVDYTIEDIKDKTEIIYEEFLHLCSYDRFFIDAISKGTSDKINERMITWKNVLKLIIEDPKFYHKKLNKKQKLFRENPTCLASGRTINSLDETDLFEEKIYHRCHSPRLIPTDRKSPNTKNTPVVIDLLGSISEFENPKDAIMFMLDIISDKIRDDEYEIERLSSLEFIGTPSELSAKRQDKKMKVFKPININNLYIDLSGSRSKILENIETMASLFSFLSDFKIINN